MAGLARGLGLLRLGLVPRFPTSLTGATKSTSTCSSESPPKKLKIMFFGTDHFALRSLEALHEECQAPSGRVSSLSVTVIPMKSLTPAVTEYARDNGLPLHLWPPDLQQIKEAGYHLGVVASFGRLLPASLISSFPLGCVNVHGSLLPR